MIDTIDADDAWCPPTFTPDDVFRTRLAWWMIDVASHSARSWIACSVDSETPSYVADMFRIVLVSGASLNRSRALTREIVQTSKQDGQFCYVLNVPTSTLDATDERILETLVQDARRSASEVGRLVGLSPPAAKRRIDRLEAEGLIRGYTAILDHDLRGEHIEAFIELRFAPASQVDEIDSALVDLPEVVESFTLAGDPDALARVHVRDLEHLKNVVDRIRRGRRGGPKVLGTRTLIVLGRTRGAHAL
jgi:Lrp/AsnC family leucine-responsive transcriptional regulator